MSCNELLLLAALASIQMAQGRSQEDVALWAAFFTVLGDDLALLAIGLPSEEDACGGSETLSPCGPPQ